MGAAAPAIESAGDGRDALDNILRAQPLSDLSKPVLLGREKEVVDA